MMMTMPESSARAVKFSSLTPIFPTDAHRVTPQRTGRKSSSPDSVLTHRRRVVRESVRRECELSDQLR